MGQLEELVSAIANGRGRAPISAPQLIKRAAELKVDVLLHASYVLSLSLEQVYERAARFLRFPYSPIVPLPPDGQEDGLPFPRLDDLGFKRALQSAVFDRQVLFVAPSADELIMLAERRQRSPETFKDICMVPPAALRRSISQRGAEELLRNARQRLALRWPNASAHLDLGRATRIGFVVMLCIFIALAGLAPFELEALSIVLLLGVFLSNSWLRLAAIFEVPDLAPVPDNELLDDDTLPVYSVLIPLRGESCMVGQLASAMRALDYPVLGSKRTN